MTATTAPVTTPPARPALGGPRFGIWRRCGTRCALKRRTSSLTNLTRSSLKRAAMQEF